MIRDSKFDKKSPRCSEDINNLVLENRITNAYASLYLLSKSLPLKNQYFNEIILMILVLFQFCFQYSFDKEFSRIISLKNDNKYSKVCLSMIIVDRKFKNNEHLLGSWFSRQKSRTIKSYFFSQNYPIIIKFFFALSKNCTSARTGVIIFLFET